ncbi:Mce-associated membrane protein [Rhodococcus sp. 27YEA15]|uniref:hypothetical protein n=1 Tax=Rhodococcus sp. 27YEA15 TaxID=3156259 RepID=UPI003C7A761E
MSRRRRTWQCISVVLAVVVATTWFLHVRPAHRDEHARDTLPAMTALAVSRMLTYAPETVADDLEAAARGLGGTFRREFEEYSRSAVIPLSTERSVAQRGDVKGVALESVNGDDAVAVVYVDQTTVSVDRTEPRTVQTVVRVRVHHDGNQWLLVSFDPIF